MTKPTTKARNHKIERSLDLRGLSWFARTSPSLVDVKLVRNFVKSKVSLRQVVDCRVSGASTRPEALAEKTSSKAECGVVDGIVV